MSNLLDQPERLVPFALLFSGALLLVQFAWSGGSVMVLPVITALVINAGLSVRILLQQGRVFVGVVALNVLQLVLFAALHYQIYHLLGPSQYDFYRPPGWFDWFEMVAGHGLRAVDVLDVFSAFGLRLHNVSAAGALSRGLVVVMLLMVDLFLFGTVLRLVHRPAPVQRLATAYGALLALLKRFRLPVLGISLVAFFLLFFADISRDWFAADFTNIVTWPLDNLLRVVDFTDAFNIFDVQLHTLPMTPWAATVAVAFRLAVGAYFLEWLDATFIRLFKGRGQTIEELGAQAADERLLLDDRLIAVAAIGRMGVYGMPAVEDLTEALGAESPRLQQAVQQALVDMGPAVVEALIEALPCRRPEITARIREVLSAIDAKWQRRSEAHDATPELIGRLLDADARTRTCALETLADIDARWALRPEASAAIPDFIDSLAHWEAAVRPAAAEALGAMGPAAGSAIYRLTRLLADESGRVRAAALIALERIDPHWRQNAAAANAVEPLADRIAGADAQQRDVLSEALATIGPAAVGPMVACLSERFSSHRRRLAVAVLTRIGPPAVDTLLPLLGATDPRVVAGAAEVLAAVKPAPISRLVVLMGQSPRQPAEQAATVLKTIGVKTIPVLVTALAQSRPPLQPRLIALLGQFGPAARKALPLIRASAGNPKLADIADAAAARIDR